MKTFLWSTILTCLFLSGIPVAAQTGAVKGKVTETGTNTPVVGAIVRVLDAEDTTKVIKGGFADSKGEYRVGGLPAGRFHVRFSSVGYRRQTLKSITLAPTDTITLNAALDPELISIDAVVVSASRRTEKALDAPASVSVLDAKDVSERIAFTPSDHLRSVTGVDIARTGLVQQSVVTRGFSNVFSGALTVLTDNRIAAIPSLRVNVPYFIPLVNDDIDRIEVVRGPGSALYGPNASSGVLHVITRSPFASKGTTLSITSGERFLFQGSFRHAGVIREKFGYKISGQYFRGKDWEYVDSVEVDKRRSALLRGAKEESLNIGRRDPIVERIGGEARLDWIANNNLTANLTFGVNQTMRAIELTDIGAAQAKKWRYTFIQGRINYRDLFLQAYLNQSDAGDTYILRTGNPVVDRSKQFVFQAQHSFTLGERERLTYGLDAFFTRPITDGTITGKNEDSDDINEYGAYAQSTTQLVPNTLDLVIAGRVDKHNRLPDAIFSPRAGLVYKPWENQNFRLTFNRAYNTPATGELFLDIVSRTNVFDDLPPEFAVDIRASGVPKEGLHFDRDQNGRPFLHSTFSPERSAPIPVDAAALLWPAVVQILAAQGKDLSQIPAPTPLQIRATMARLNVETGSFDPVSGPSDVAPLKPTITQTIEFGYSGVIPEKLQIGVDVYRSKVTDFTAPFHVVTPSVFLHEGDLRAYLRQQGLSEEQAAQCAALVSAIPLGTVTPREAVDPTAILVAPSNFGQLNLFGVDLSLEYWLSEHFSIGGTYSYVEKNFFEKVEGVADLALNAPRHKGSLSLRYRNSGIGMSAELRNRWTGRFRMSSSDYVGTVQEYSLLDATVNYTLPSFTSLTMTLSASNLLDKRHQEFIGAPAIGRLILGRLTYTF